MDSHEDGVVPDGFLPDSALGLGIRIGQGFRVTLGSPVGGGASDGVVKRHHDDRSITGGKVGGVSIISECVRLIDGLGGVVDQPPSREWVGGRSCLIILCLVKEQSRAHSTVGIVIEVVGSVGEAEEMLMLPTGNMNPWVMGVAARR
jgi:hypothetical protein